MLYKILTANSMAKMIKTYLRYLRYLLHFPIFNSTLVSIKGSVLFLKGRILATELEKIPHFSGVLGWMGREVELIEKTAKSLFYGSGMEILDRNEYLTLDLGFRIYTLALCW